MNAFKWSWAMVMVAAPFASVSASWLDGRPYIGAGASYSIYDNLHDLASDRDDVTRQRLSKNTFGFTGVAGWTFPGNYSLEIGYTDFGEFEIEELDEPASTEVNIDGSMTGKSIGMRYDWSESRSMNVYGRVGVMRWELAWDGTSTTTQPGLVTTSRFSSDTDGTDFYYAIGGQYQLMPNLYAYVEGYLLDGKFDKDGFGSDQRVYAVYGGIRFRFGDVARPSGTTDKRTREVTACDPKYKDLSGIMCEQ